MKKSVSELLCLLMKINDYDVKGIVCGEKYLGELLIVDFGISGVDEEKWYVVLNDGEIVEVVEWRFGLILKKKGVWLRRWKLIWLKVFI